MKSDSYEDKTEKPTEHHIKKFKKRGQTKYSRELNSLLILIFGIAILWLLKNIIVFKFIQIISDSFIFNKSIIFSDKENILFSIFLNFKKILIIFFPFFLLLIFISIIFSIWLSGIKFSCKSLKFNFKKLNPINGLRKIFSIQIFIELFKLILKLFIITGIVIWCFSIFFNKIFLLNTQNIFVSFANGLNIILYFCYFVLLGFIPIVILDVIWKEWNYYKKLKMTRQELKDEFKEQEGHPHIKTRIRQLMRLHLRKRMISDVSKSDVIITNPIQYSIALKYDQNSMKAPKVVAKGLGDLAIKIKDIAEKNNIPIISSPLLARSLYRYSEIGNYIPGPLYQAVAEILAWVWKLKEWKKKGGIFPEKPKNISIPPEFRVTGETKNND